MIRTSVQRRGVALGCTVALAIVVLCLVYDGYRDSYWSFAGTTEMPSAYGLQPASVVPASFRSVLESSQAPLIELPIGADGIDPRLHALAMYHAIEHRRPILNGYSSYWPTGFVERMADANRLPARDALDRLVETTGLSLIWLHSQWLTPEQRSAWASQPEPSGRLTLVAQEGPEILFAVAPSRTTAQEASSIPVR